MAADVAAATLQRRVRVWFGQHVIADYRAEPALAERYAHVMSRRFAGLRVTNDPISSAPEALAGERSIKSMRSNCAMAEGR